MKKTIISFLFLSFLVTTNAQTIDSVSTGASNANTVFYSFKNGIIKTQPNSDWDLAFEISGFSASILANHAKGLVVYQSPFSFANWATFDTSNYSTWKKMYNSPQLWSVGAFNLHTNTDPYDLGWGTYDPASHIVSGDSIFLVKLANGTLKKLTILNLSTGIYSIRYSNLDGSNESTKSIDKANYKNKNFGYFAFDTETSLDREPLTADWDIAFTKYTEFIPTAYNVAGVWTNKGNKTAEARNVSVTTTNYSPFRFSDSNSIIGYDWKKYNASLNKYDITSNLVYFVTTKEATWKLVFTGYKGGANGTFYFSKEAMSASLQSTKLTSCSIYPNPSQSSLSIKLPSNNQLIKYSIQSISGQTLAEGKDSTLNISGLTAGIYYLTLNTTKGIQTLKFSKI